METVFNSPAKPKGTGTQITWFEMQCPFRMQTICNRVNVIGALRGRAHIQNAIIYCHCHGSPVERCCSENHLRASLECHELIRGLEQDRRVNTMSRAITGNRYPSLKSSFYQIFRQVCELTIENRKSILKISS